MTPYSMADADAEFVAASAVGDLAAIDAASARIDALDEHKPPPSLLAAALWYAQQGLCVFPLQPGRKAPLKQCDPCFDSCPGPEVCGHELCHGLKDATLDPDLIRKWWAEDLNRNIGIATGGLVDVIDVDGPAGVKSWAEFLDDLPSIVGRVSTPRPGGNHLYVAATPGRRSKTGLLPSVDYRGDGGYVVVPPSVIAPGGKDAPGTYVWHRPLDFTQLRGSA